MTTYLFYILGILNAKNLEKIKIGVKRIKLTTLRFLSQLHALEIGE